MCGGGSSAPTETKVTQTNLPPYVEPYVQDLLTRAGYASSVPYQPFESQRLAYFTPTEQEALIRTSQLGLSGTSPELQQAGVIANTIGSGGFSPNISSNASSGYSAGELGSSYAPSGLNAKYSPASRNSGYFAGARQVGYNPYGISSTYTPGEYDKESEYVAGQREMGFEPGTLADQEMLQRYSDPYMQMVVDIQKREAGRQADIRNSQTGLQAAGQGSLGGYREGIIRSENERNLMQQMGDIQTQGSQQAFFNAQQAFEADRAARAQKEQFGQSQFGLNEQAKQRMAELMLQGYSTQEAAKQAAQQFGLSAYQLTQQAQQAKEQFGQSQFGLNQSARQTQEQLAQGQYGLTQQAQQARAQLQIQAYQASEQAKQQAAQLQIQAYQAAEQAKQEASRLGLDAAKINQAGQVAYANVMMQSQQNQLQAAGMLGQFSNQQQNMELERLNAALQAGAMERGLMQQGLDIGYQDYLRQQAYPWEQLGLYGNTIYQQPFTPGATTSTYGTTPSPWAQAAGTGISGLGLYNAFQAGQQ